ncbi:MAG: helix-hairpin-helix domain-containing protein [Bacteroidetes bacterium]|nr:helix-hairpin-helix domain-containing protein [Bacteroidota bacterium]
MNKDVAKAIIIYRAQHGDYTKIDDIKKIVFIKDELYNKIAPYLAVE